MANVSVTTTTTPLPKSRAWSSLHNDKTSVKAIYRWAQGVENATLAVTYLLTNTNANAVLAYSQANAAFAKANLAYTAANSAQTAANSVSSQANAAYAAANSAANLVAIFANGTLVLADANLNFNNTATINLSATANGTTQVNVAFSINTTMNLVSLNVTGNIANTGNLAVSQNTVTGNLTITQNTTTGNINVSGVSNSTGILIANASPLTNAKTQVVTGLAAYKAPTSTSGNTTLTVDNSLILTFNEAGRYVFEGYLVFFEPTPGTGGFQFDLGANTAITANLIYDVQGFSTAGLAFTAAVTANNTAVAVAAASTSATAPSWLRFKGSVQVTTAGYIGVRWAQNTVSANLTNLLENSYFVAEKIG